MKRVLLIMAVSLLALPYACKKSSTLDREGDLQLSQCKDYRFSGETVKLCFNELVSDSRCPENMMCIWEGSAVGSFTFTKDQQSHVIKLATTTYPGPEKRDTILAGYKIELLDIRPHPKHPPVNTPPADITAQVRVTKI